MATASLKALAAYVGAGGHAYLLGNVDADGDGTTDRGEVEAALSAGQRIPDGAAIVDKLEGLRLAHEKASTREASGARQADDAYDGMRLGGYVAGGGLALGVVSSFFIEALPPLFVAGLAVGGVAVLVGLIIALYYFVQASRACAGIETARHEELLVGIDTKLELETLRPFVPQVSPAKPTGQGGFALRKPAY